MTMINPKQKNKLTIMRKDSKKTTKATNNTE